MTKTELNTISFSILKAKYAIRLLILMLNLQKVSIYSKLFTTSCLQRPCDQPIECQKEENSKEGKRHLTHEYRNIILEKKNAKLVIKLTKLTTLSSHLRPLHHICTYERVIYALGSVHIWPGTQHGRGVRVSKTICPLSKSRNSPPFCNQL